MAAADAMFLLGRAALHHGHDARAGELLERSLAEFERLGETWQQARTLGRLGQLTRLRGEYPRARTHLEAALGLHRRTGDRHLVAWTTWQLGVLARYSGDYPRAAKLCQESLVSYQEHGGPAPWRAE